VCCNCCNVQRSPYSHRVLDPSLEFQGDTVMAVETTDRMNEWKIPGLTDLRYWSARCHRHTISQIVHWFFTGDSADGCVCERLQVEHFRLILLWIFEEYDYECLRWVNKLVLFSICHLTKTRSVVHLSPCWIVDNDCTNKLSNSWKIPQTLTLTCLMFNIKITICTQVEGILSTTHVFNTWLWLCRRRSVYKVLFSDLKLYSDNNKGLNQIVFVLFR